MNTKPLEAELGALLRKRGQRLALAESCTGGLLGHRITNIPGSSTYYMGSVTAYAYEAKVRLLGVRWETLEENGAVSEATALEMAAGARRALAADIGLSITGIAGPGGGTPEKPVGLTWIGLSAPGYERAWQYIWDGDRLAVKEQSAEQALRLLVDHLEGKGEAEKVESISVQADVRPTGKLYPQSFLWRDNTYQVESSGRRWEDEEGEHILVMTPEKQSFELLYKEEESTWFLVRQVSGSGLA